MDDPKRDAIDTTNQLRQKCTILSLLVPPSLYNVIFFKKKKIAFFEEGHYIWLGGSV